MCRTNAFLCARSQFSFHAFGRQQYVIEGTFDVCHCICMVFRLIVCNFLSYFSLQQVTHSSSRHRPTHTHTHAKYNRNRSGSSWNYLKIYTIATFSTTRPATRAIRANIVMSQQRSVTKRRASYGLRSPVSIVSVPCVT